ncbi:DUF885 domain-containing protein [Aquilutibacter rugosus]|uniref:DUF885 domain-containing protein n=1 Tax=Aquilutibacter rugosus TaxID=3115820 RepID=UPI002F411666
MSRQTLTARPAALALAIALTLGATTVAPLSVAQAATSSTATASSSAATAPATAPASPEWVKRSNEFAQILLKAQVQFSPESASFFGIPGYDDKVFDLGPNLEQRQTQALEQAMAQLNEKLQVERDPNVRQDLQIMINQAKESIDGIAISQRNLVTWIDVPGAVFGGVQGLLSDQVQAERRPFALTRLQRYLGLAPGSTPLTQLAKDRYAESLQRPNVVMPSKLEVEDALAKTDIYIAGIGKLFEKYKFTDAGPALAALKTQMTDYAQWTRTEVLPKARPDARLPAEVYAYSLRQKGIDISPQELIARAETQFMETRAAMRQLAPLVAKQQGLKNIKDPSDYVAVLKALKSKTIPNDKLESSYRTVIDQIDPIIRRERIVDVPQRPMVMRLGSEAESAAQPAPHFLPAPMIGNTGQQGQFVLPMTVKGADGKSLAYDDFNNESVRWTLSAHEGRPGHELQFTRMLEKGVSMARSMFAFNSVNVEGWALYAEAEMVPYEPLDGQLFALQFRLMRAARAILDPMLNLGLTDRARAGEILEQDVGLSPAMAKQELDRYMFNSPGQAGSYFYGYQRLMQLRMDTEVKMGRKFDRLGFNNFILDQGMLPPELLKQAVDEQFAK